MLRATHGQWMEITHMLHSMTANWIHGLKSIALQTEIEQQYALGHENIDEEFWKMIRRHR